MIKKSIVAIVVIVAAAALVFGASGNHINSANNSTINSDQQKQQLNAKNGSNLDNTGTADNNNNQVKISPAEAQKIAQKYIEVSNATAGTPTLADGIYTVPVMINGTNVGEIDIDALTGKNVGGAGGAPDQAVSSTSNN